MTGEELHSHLDEIERIHGLYSPIALGFAAALACSCFTFLLAAALWKCCVPSAVQAIGNFVRCKLTKHHFTLFLGITGVGLFSKPRVCHPAEAGRGAVCRIGAARGGVISAPCSSSFRVFPFITSGFDLAKLDMRSGLERPGLRRPHHSGGNHDGLDHGTAAAFAAGAVPCPEPDTPGRDRVPACWQVLAVWFGFSLMFNSPGTWQSAPPYRCGNETRSDWSW